MTPAEQLRVSTILSTTEVVARVSRLDLLASGRRQRTCAPPGFLEGHQFAVSSLEQTLAVKVITVGAEPGQLLVTLRPPADSGNRRRSVHILTEQAGQWLWNSKNQAPTPGAWWLEVCWVGAAKPAQQLFWAYQVWSRSSLHARLQLPQRTTTGADLTGQITLSGSGLSMLRHEAYLRQPPDSPDATIAALIDSSPALQAALKKQRSQHWPNDPTRSWWRLGREHKLAALAEAKLGARFKARDPRIEREADGPAIPERAPLGGPSDAVKLTLKKNSPGYDLRLNGQHVRAAGTYTFEARLTGYIGTNENDRFERVLSRQVVAEPEADADSTVTTPWAGILAGVANVGVIMSLWDAYGNPVFVTDQTPVELSLPAKRMPRGDGKLAWAVNAADAVALDAGLTLRGKQLARGLQVPRVDVGFEGIVRDANPRMPHTAMKEALDPRKDGPVLGLRAKEALVVQVPPGKTARFVSVFSRSLAAYAVEAILGGGKVDRVGIGRGARRFPVKLAAGESVRVRAVDGSGQGELELVGLRFE